MPAAGRVRAAPYTWGLRVKLCEANECLATDKYPLHEVHPEVSFAAMNNGKPLIHRKISWTGHVTRGHFSPSRASIYPTSSVTPAMPASTTYSTPPPQRGAPTASPPATQADCPPNRCPTRSTSAFSTNRSERGTGVMSEPSGAGHTGSERASERPQGTV